MSDEYEIAANVIQNAFTRILQSLTVSAALYTAIIFVVATIINGHFAVWPRTAAPIAGGLAIAFWNFGLWRYLDFEFFVGQMAIRRMMAIEDETGRKLTRQIWGRFRRAWDSEDQYGWNSLEDEERKTLKGLSTTVPAAPGKVVKGFLLVTALFAVSLGIAAGALVYTGNFDLSTHGTCFELQTAPNAAIQFVESDCAN